MSDYAHIPYIIKVAAAIKYRPRVESIVIKGMGTSSPKVLVQKKEEGALTFPGGGIDPGEEATDAAERETGEEAGVRSRNHEDLMMTMKRRWTKAEIKRRHKKGKDREGYSGSSTSFVASEYVPGRHELFGSEGDEQKPIWWSVSKAKKYLDRLAKSDSPYAEINQYRVDALSKAVDLDLASDG